MIEPARTASRALCSALAIAWAVASLAVLLPIGFLARPFDPEQRTYDLLSRVWARVALVLAGVRLVVTGAEVIDRDRRYVIVVNHQSTLDPPVLVAALQPHLQIRFLAKRSLFRLPVIGWGMRMYGHVRIDRERVRRSLPELERAREGVQSRWSTVFFAEGTRTRTGRLQPFRSGAFRMAARAQVPILPVTVDGTFAALPSGSLLIRWPATVSVTIHPPQPPPAAGHRAARSAAEDCRAAIESALSAGREAG